MVPTPKSGRRLLAVVCLLATVATGCGSSPTTTEEPPADAGGAATEQSGAPEAADGQDGAAALEQVYAEVEGLTGDERRRKLIELAADEGELNLYTSTNIDESGPITEAFEEATGLPVSLYRASSANLLQRVLQEAQAGFAGADVIMSNGPEMTIYNREGLLAPLNSPATEGNAVVFDTWAGTYLNVFIAAWNTDLVAPEDVPTSWEDVFSNYQGRMVFQLDDTDWFATLVNWYVEEEGMTEEEAIAMFKEGAAGNTPIDGHTTAAELLAAGEYAVASSLYQHRIPRLQAEGAPVAWEPAVEPLILRPNGIGIPVFTQRPASALLFTEFMLTDAQPMLAEFERTPALRTVEGGVPAEYDPIPVDLELLLDERENWESLYEEVVNASGTEPIEGD
ncbi:MAG: extracellular solute-binding protein [Nitriliruptorales bacterium]|nr:extracellular solute-binding protein [Nitriliruptorales bacterium]